MKKKKPQRIWIWASPDGDYIASSRARAMAKMEFVFPGGTWTKDENGDDVYDHPLLRDDENGAAYVIGIELNGWR